MRCLVIGASGQVGGQLLTHALAAGHECTGTTHRRSRLGMVALDLRDAAAVSALMWAVQPQVVFLPAAWTNVDLAQTHPTECHAVNLDGTAHVARAVHDLGGLLVFFSTEHVFADSVQGHAEETPLAPRSVYAQSKAAGEELVRDLLPDAHLILRTSWVFGPEEQRKNFAYRAIRTLRSGETLTVPDDQHGQPTYGPDLAATACALVGLGLRGTFHVVGPEYLSRLAFARMIAEVFRLNAELVRGVPTVQLGQAAPRPLRPFLRRTKLCAALGRDPIRGPALALAAWRTGAEF
jgi:dTDP-4-dehydrorhamnose reductase